MSVSNIYMSKSMFISLSISISIPMCISVSISVSISMSESMSISSLEEAPLAYGTAVCLLGGAASQIALRPGRTKHHRWETRGIIALV